MRTSAECLAARDKCAWARSKFEDGGKIDEESINLKLVEFVLFSAESWVSWNKLAFFQLAVNLGTLMFARQVATVIDLPIVRLSLFTFTRWGVSVAIGINNP